MAHKKWIKFKKIKWFKNIVSLKSYLLFINCYNTTIFVTSFKIIEAKISHPSILSFFWYRNSSVLLQMPSVRQELIYQITESP